MPSPRQGLAADGTNHLSAAGFHLLTERARVARPSPPVCKSPSSGPLSAAAFHLLVERARVDRLSPPVCKSPSSGALSAAAFHLLVERARVDRLSPPVCKSPSSDSGYRRESFGHLVERARMASLSQGERVSPPACGNIEGDTGKAALPTGDSSPTAYPLRPKIQGHRRAPIRTATRDSVTNTSPPPMVQCEAARTLEPYLERMTQVLERLELLVHSLPQEATPVPTPIHPMQQTTVRYNVEAYGHEIRSTPTTNMLEDQSSASRGATPRSSSPDVEGGAETSISAPGGDSSGDEMESWHSAPLPGYDAAAAAGMTRINTYLNIRLADIVGADPIVNKYDTCASVSQPDAHMSDDIPMHAMVGEQPGHDEVVPTIKKTVPSHRTLKDWLEDIHQKGGDATRGRPSADSPISHHNHWVRVSRDTLMDTGEEKEMTLRTTNVIPPTSDTPISVGTNEFSVYDGGGEHTREYPSASLADDRPLQRRAYIIRVDHMKPTRPLDSIDSPSRVIVGGKGHARGALMDTGEETEGFRLVQPTSDSVFDGGGVPTDDRPSARGADNHPMQTCTVRLKI